MQNGSAAIGGVRLIQSPLDGDGAVFVQQEIFGEFGSPRLDDG